MPRRRRSNQLWSLWLVPVVTFLVTARETPLRAQEVERTPATYTVEQADAGLNVYRQYCSSCHGDNLDDGPFAPPLRGVEFQARWHFRSLEALFDQTSATMPQDRPGSLTDDTYVQLLAFVLQENGIEPGETELPADLDALAALSPGWSSSGGGLSAGIALPTVPVRRNPLDSIRPVTDAMLQNAEPEDWLLWRRTYDAAGYSPLDQIDTTNVHDLRVAWSWSLPPGPSESTPIVHDGVLFVHGYGDKVYALDAASGDLLWRYARRLPRDRAPGLKRGMSIYGARLFVPTSDVHVVALDVKTGSVVWDQAIIADVDGGAQRRLSGGTLVAKGKVIVGTTGRAEGGNYIVALDADTGQEAWRFGTIPPPQLPGGNSWNGLPHEERNGGSVWIPGSYDPVNNLAFFGPGTPTTPRRCAIRCTERASRTTVCISTRRWH